MTDIREIRPHAAYARGVYGLCTGCDTPVSAPIPQQRGTR